MLDLGLDKGNEKRTEEYMTKYLKDLISEEQISGEVYIGEIKKIPAHKKGLYEFQVIITDHETQQKWICDLETSYYPETGNIFAEKRSKVYNFIDSLNHIINKTPKNYPENYSAHFDTFRQSINDEISNVTVKAIHPTSLDSKDLDIVIISAQRKGETGRIIPSSIEDIADEFPQARMAVVNLREKGKEITLGNMESEFESMLNKGEIEEREFKHALREIEKVKTGR